MNDTEYRLMLADSHRKLYRENSSLRKILVDSIKAFRLIRDGAEGPEIRILARDLVNQLEELNVGKGKQAPADPGPQVTLPGIAHKEST
jgi:hypothetical protein